MLLLIKSYVEKHHWKEKNPYHYCFEVIVEKYAQWLERNNVVGDTLAERRGKADDKALEEEYLRVIQQGTQFVSAENIRKNIVAEKLKMRHKNENISGLQLVDLIANPAYRYIRKQQKHDVKLIGLTKTITDILVYDKFDRSSRGKIDGYGIKYLS